MKKVLVFGGSGLVGSKFIDQNKNIFEMKYPSATEVNILDKTQVIKVVQEFNPDTVINFAAFTQVEEAESQRGDKGGICYLINALGAKIVADTSKQFNAKLIHISTEYVFDGTKEDRPYVEEDRPNPINWYGQTKYFGEQFVLESGCTAMVVRLSMPFSANYALKKDIARFFLEELKNGNQVRAVEDQKITPTLVLDIANALKELIESQRLGIYHISSRDSVTPLEFVKTIAEIFHLNHLLISSIGLDELNKNKKAKLLQYSWLNPAKFEKDFGDQILHTAEEGLIIFKTEIDQLK